MKKSVKKYPHLTEAKKRVFQKHKTTEFGKSPTENASDAFIFFVKHSLFSTLSDQSKSKSRRYRRGGPSLGDSDVFLEKSWKVLFRLQIGHKKLMISIKIIKIKRLNWDPPPCQILGGCHIPCHMGGKNPPLSRPRRRWK